MPGDVPLATAEEIGRVLELHGPAPAMTIVPSRDRRGSNAIACSPPDLISFRFGDDSFYPHLAVAREQGIEPRICPLPGLGLDIDTPDDLTTFLQRPARTRAHGFLQKRGIAERMAGRRRPDPQRSVTAPAGPLP